ncbi:MAG: hypothetical protein N2Z23_05265 [Pyrinomonadaceae bacterium]|nr:hypothetical protein [Pyrinomonadaceae bacterium]MCX7639833.1 hypothetical protein [Pyrinomonadaceae bacterium]MDW8304005.1 hypothetical protein [Acidobacteriota bacterium]
MSKATETLQIVFSSKSLLIAVFLLLVFLLCLIAFSVALINKYADPALQKHAILLVIFLPLLGFAVAVLILWQNIEKLVRSKFDQVVKLMPPEAQRKKLNDQVYELASILEITGDDLSNLRAAYVLAEDLALRQIEQENRVPLKRHVSFGEAQFDAVFLDKKYLTFVEVTFVVTPSISEEKIKKLFEKIEKARKNFEKIRSKHKIKLLFAIVTQLEKDSENKLKKFLIEKFSSTIVDTDIRFFDFEALQEKYTE